jgi:alkane 1-monooxygenase
VRHSPLAAVPFLVGYPMAPIVMLCLTERGWWTFVPVAVMFLAVPLADMLIGAADAARESPDLDRNPYFKAVTWGWVPIQLGLLAWVLTTVATQDFTALEVVGATLSMGGVAGAVGITFAHELVHRSHPVERGLGEALLASVCYTHFAIEHVHGHHRQVATPHDPATARFGESFYRFLPRTVAGSLASAWHLERDRLTRRGRPFWSTSNRMLRYGLTQALLFPAIASVWGAAGVIVFAGQAVIAISILEVINYVEHYGLMRKEIAPGEYERIGPQHSWDSPYRLSNWMLINLARHSDHHCQASKRYQSLELLPLAPQLPGGYGVMFLLALVPPLWFRVMNPRLTATASSSAR